MPDLRIPFMGTEPRPGRTASGYGRAGCEPSSPSPWLRPAERPRGSSRTDSRRPGQKSAARRLQPSTHRAPCARPACTGERHHSHHRSQPPARPPRAEPGSAAQLSPCPHSPETARPADYARDRSSDKADVRVHSGALSPQNRTTFRTTFRESPKIAAEP